MGSVSGVAPLYGGRSVCVSGVAPLYGGRSASVSGVAPPYGGRPAFVFISGEGWPTVTPRHTFTMC